MNICCYCTLCWLSNFELLSAAINLGKRLLFFLAYVRFSYLLSSKYYAKIIAK